GDKDEVVIFRNDFDFPENIENVSADILTLGFFEAYLNGTKISDDLYAPAWTNYSQMDLRGLSYPLNDTFCFRSYFMRYDMTAAAKAGKNAFALHIGNGWHGQWESQNEGIRRYGEKKLCFKITVRTKDGKEKIFSSNDGGTYRGSFIKKSSMYFGEIHDLRLMSEDIFTADMNGEAFSPVLKTEKPYTLVQRQTCPPDRVLRRIADPKVIREFGDQKIYDLGENLSGFAVLKFGGDARKNENVVVRYAENLNEDGSLNFHSTGSTSRLSVDVFRSGGGAVSKNALLYPRFLWHTGRYVEVTGWHEFVSFCVAASDVPVTSEFRSSDEVLNWIYDAYIRTQTDNIHTCVPSDCPHRERLGYTGDGQLAAGAVMTAYDARGLYKKWMRDIADSQDIYNGHVEHTAPFYGGGGGPGGWGCAVVHVPYLYWKFYGDETVLREYYPHIKKYLDYMESRCDGHIVMREEPQGWCLGDWCTPHNSKRGILIPEPYVNTYFYIRSLREAIEIAPLVGEEADIPGLKAREEAAAKAFVEKFMDPETGSFCNEVCGADAFALDLGLGDGRTLANLVKHYRELGTFDTGIFGTPFVVKVLFENGYGDDAYKLLANRGEVSFFHMMDSGATTLWEEWFNEHSSNHPMFGAVVEFLFKYILGIKQKAGSVGFEQIEIGPAPVPSLDWAEGSVTLGGKTVFVRVEKGRVVKKEIC
ncbi:MAG: family 78 glycoside hydrolase catalytic domain, partial [Clostridia bacterium]|nr:family 78 glycoside hydrolase catalytic domain [Clostridia bacterium]